MCAYMRVWECTCVCKGAMYSSRELTCAPRDAYVCLCLLITQIVSKHARLGGFIEYVRACQCYHVFTLVYTLYVLYMYVNINTPEIIDRACVFTCSCYDVFTSLIVTCLCAYECYYWNVRKHIRQMWISETYNFIN